MHMNSGASGYPAHPASGHPATIEHIECHVFRAPIETPVKAAVGSFSNRPAVFVRVVASDGAWGWGEVFCNFPPVGAEHRARLARDLIAPMLAGAACNDPTAVWRMLTERLRRMALQAGEPGPMAQVTSAIDQALWDMQARRAGQPLWRVLAAAAGTSGTAADGRIRLYASGIGPDKVAETALAKLAQGYSAFKFKVGFEPARDMANFREIRDVLGRDARIMVDANQAWAPDIAAERIAALESFNPYWVEEPMAADESLDDWRRLARGTSLALAAGENIRGQADFEAAIDNGHLRFIQPDVAKWGGISGCMAVARYAQIAGLTFCPHWLGGGIGLAASSHLRAALGPAGMVEVDANPNPLREAVWMPPQQSASEDGWITLPDTPGIGAEPDLDALAGYRVDF
jgi:L-alanine-DL-glutamate epimerase-like enolase superfamily enzyme